MMKFSSEFAGKDFFCLPPFAVLQKTPLNFRFFFGNFIEECTYYSCHSAIFYVYFFLFLLKFGNFYITMWFDSNRAAEGGRFRPRVHIVLVEPEIPQNCGNIARTCAATGSVLHLIRPLGFDISEKAVRRAGLDYWHLVEIHDYENLDDFFRCNPQAASNLWLATTKAPRPYTEAAFFDGCYLFFGKETAGLPLSFRRAHEERCIRLPMREEARSLNLSNSVAILTYEALRQQGFPGLLDVGEMAEE